MSARSIYIIFKEKFAPDIRFWILLFFVFRLYGITNAPLEIGHSWRQSLTNMIARNFLKYKLTLEAIADRVSSKNDLIAINGDKNPQLMYFIHRKGWSVSMQQLLDVPYLSGIKDAGCKYLFLDKHKLELPVTALKLNFISVFENEDFVVYSLKN